MSTDTLPLGIGILSWRGHDSLKRVLPTYQAGGLFEGATETLLFLPEPEDRTVDLGKRYGLRVETAPENLGILGGFKAIANTLSSPVLLLLEDDCPLIEPRDETRRQLTLGANALLAGEVEAFRMRHRLFPGASRRFGVIDKVHRYFPTDTASLIDQIMAAMRRSLRPGKATRLSSNLLYEQADAWADPYTLDPDALPVSPAMPRPLPPEEMFPEHMSKTQTGYYRVNAAAIPWSNQSIMVRRDFYRERIIGFAEERPSRRQVNGFSDIEKELNSAYWRRSDWHVGLDRGLFAHELCD